MTREELAFAISKVSYNRECVAFDHALRIADRILAALAAEKTDEATEKGLVEELREWVREGAPMERRLTGFSDAIAEIAEILSRHTAPTKWECGYSKEDLRNMLEDVVNALCLSEATIEKHGPLGTAPAKLVEEVLAEKDLTIKLLRQGFKDAGHPAPVDKEPLAVGIVKGLVDIGECVCEADGYLGPQPCAICKARAWLEAQGDK